MVLKKILSSGLKLLQNQESCIVNGGTTINYFKLEKVTRQCDPISAYLFILVLEIVFLFTKESKKINVLTYLIKRDYSFS